MPSDPSVIKEQFQLAVFDMATENHSLRERVANAVRARIEISRIPDEDVPEDDREEFVELRDALTAAEPLSDAKIQRLANLITEIYASLSK